MFKKVLLTSILTIAATTTFVMADGDKKVTSKNYVDTNFQTKIPVNSVTIETKSGEIGVPNALIVSPDNTPGGVGEIGIWDADLNNVPAFAQSVTGNSITPVDEALLLPDLMQNGDLIPTAEVIGFAAANSLEQKQNKMTCAGWPDGVAHIDENCWLWNKN